MLKKRAITERQVWLLEISDTWNPSIPGISSSIFKHTHATEEIESICLNSFKPQATTCCFLDPFNCPWNPRVVCNMEGTQENPTPITAADCTLPETAASLGTVGGQTDGAGPGHAVRTVSPHMCHADNWSRMGRAITGCFDFFQTLFLKAVSQLSLVNQSCLTLRDPMDWCTPPPCPSPTPRACSNSYPLSRWCHPTISSSVAPFSTCLQSFPASGSFPMSQFFTLNGQSISISTSASVLSMNIQDWFRLGLTGLISLKSKKDSQESPPTPQLKSINSSAFSFLYGPTLTSTHDYWKKTWL